MHVTQTGIISSGGEHLTPSTRFMEVFSKEIVIIILLVTLNHLDVSSAMHQQLKAFVCLFVSSPQITKMGELLSEMCLSLWQEVMVKEKLAAIGKPLRKFASTPNLAAAVRCTTSLVFV